MSTSVRCMHGMVGMRQRHPRHRIAIFYIQAPRQVVYERVATRAAAMTASGSASSWGRMAEA